MTTIVEFLQQRYDEIERNAKLAVLAAHEQDQWVITTQDSVDGGTHLRRRWVTGEPDEWSGPIEIMANVHPAEDPDWAARVNGLAHHVAGHDPAYVLADIAAKRKILKLHRPRTLRSTGSSGGYFQACSMCEHFPAGWPCWTVRYLALPFASHPDYDEEEWWA